MASTGRKSEDDVPNLVVTTPTTKPKNEEETHPSSHEEGSKLHRRRIRRQSRTERPIPKHIHLDASAVLPKSPATSVYRGSYSHSPRRSRASLSGSIKSAGNSTPASPRASISQSHLDHLLQDLNLDLETYGVEELRDGFFDGSFFKPPKTNHEDLMREAEHTLPAAFQKRHPLSPKHFLPKQWDGIKGVLRSVTTTRAGIQLTKSFLAFFIAYILCLIPAVTGWLGRYSYIMVLSTLINHSGRTVGGQIDGALLTICGSATGLGWGAFALWVSDSTAAAREGYGGILATFLVLFMGTIAVLRSYYVRVYQFVLCAGISMSYTCLANTSEQVNWKKLFDYGIPWVLGQAICLLLCCIIFPDAGARPLAVSFHNAFEVMKTALIFPHSDSVALHRQLAWTFVNLSQAYRDLILDLSITRFKPSDVMSLRNLMQAVIRSFLSLKMDTELFDDIEQLRTQTDKPTLPQGSQDFSSVGVLPCGMSPRSQSKVGDDVVIPIDKPRRPSFLRTGSKERALRLVADKLADPTSELLSCMRASLASCDAVLMNMSGYRKYIGPPESVSSDILGALTKIRKAMIKYDEEENSLMQNPALPPTYSDHPEVVELFLFIHPIRQAASAMEKLLVKINEMQQRHPGWRVYLPSYPFTKSLHRTNAQVRHDRGGLTAGFYFHNQAELAKTMRGKDSIYKPLPRQSNMLDADDTKVEVRRGDTMGKYEEEEEVAMNNHSTTSREKRLRYRLWMILHRLQGFETRFALKLVIVTSLLSVPAWLPQSRGWWNDNESWWAVITVWFMMHPRVGGNVQDLITRSLCGLLGAVWGGLAYGADDGNPYVMAVFAAFYMIPMIYRYTQSSHPRSGIMGCISFVVVSLGAKSLDGLPSVVKIAWTRGVAFVVGVVAAVVVNWILWPFVARHELRKALSGMMIYSSIIYRGVVAKYVYYEAGEEPGEKDIERSEMLEGRLREGFVRIRQLMALTRHEIRLRAPFNPLPYSALIDACERFFEYLVSVRQSSIFFHPHYLSDDEQAAESLLAYRRDAVAAILMNLYVLAGALRGDRKVPRYLPSAAAARKRLLDHMAEIEAQRAHKEGESIGRGEERPVRRWAQIYSYSYSQSLTGCVMQLEQLQKYTKEIVGEKGFDPLDVTDYEDITQRGKE